MIIGIDGASDDLSVALAERDGARVVEERWHAARRQSAELMPRIIGLFRATDRRIDDLTGIAVGTGPGSFTGLRVAIAIAKGLARGLVVPIVGVPSLASWLDADTGASAAVARAGARDAYLLVRGDAGPRIVDRDELAAAVGEAGRLVVPGEVAIAFGLRGTLTPNGALAIARTALGRLADDPAGDDVSVLEPIYLRAPHGMAVESAERVRWL